jgi:hypothetical protein
MVGGEVNEEQPNVLGSQLPHVCKTWEREPRGSEGKSNSTHWLKMTITASVETATMTRYTSWCRRHPALPARSPTAPAPVDSDGGRPCGEG